MKILRETMLAALLISMPVAALGQVQAGSAAAVAAAATTGDHSALLLESGTGRVLTLRAPAANVFVADPKVAEVRPASAASLFVFGVSAGRTTVAALDNAGHTIIQYDVTVQPSAFGANQTQAMIARLVPGSRVQVQAQSKGLLLSGVVGSASDAAQAVAIAKGFAADGQAIENQISITSPIQVTLKVRMAEVSREVVRNLGINWQSLATIGRIGLLPALTLNANANSVACIATGASSGGKCPGVNFNGVIDALASDNLARVLAEPNLTVMSGQSASFLVGGQYPIPVAQQNNAITIDYKNYGVSLSFLPTVYSDGRINLHVAPEVSKLSNQNSVQVAAGTSNLTGPVTDPQPRRDHG